MPEKPLPFANTTEFNTALGLFYTTWSATELAIDCAIWKALGTETAEEAHERSARAMFSEKCEQLRTLIESAEIPHGEKVKELLTQIEHHSMRNVFAHSFLASDEHSVAFIHRKKGRGKHAKYEVKPYKVSRDDFFDHVQNFVQLAYDFQQAVGLTDEEVATNRFEGTAARKGFGDLVGAGSTEGSPRARLCE
jgi:hypothetical protein